MANPREIAANLAATDALEAWVQAHRNYMAPHDVTPEGEPDYDKPLQGTWVIDGIALVVQWRCLDDELPEGAEGHFYIRYFWPWHQSPALTLGMYQYGVETVDS